MKAILLSTLKVKMDSTWKFSPLKVVLCLLLALTALLLGARTALAGFISTPSLDLIYEQAAFGNNPITVNYLPPGATIFSSALATIDNNAELNQLFGMAPDASPIVDAFFVDEINFCGVVLPNIVGCAFQPGHTLMVDSGFASGVLGDIDIGHELGHNLNLGHIGNQNSTGNLMNPVLNSRILDNVINANSNPPGGLGQIDQILSSALVQTDPTDGHLFINIRPIAVVVPEPGTFVLFGLGMGLVLVWRRTLAA